MLLIKTSLPRLNLYLSLTITDLLLDIFGQKLQVYLILLNDSVTEYKPNKFYHYTMRI